MTDHRETAPLHTAVERTDLAEKIAKSLMMFPLQPRPEDDPKEYYHCLEISFTVAIIKILNEAANDRNSAIHGRRL